MRQIHSSAPYRGGGAGCQAEPSAEALGWGALWHLAWPLVATMFLLFSVGLADVYVAGLFGPEVQGAVGFAGQLLFLFTVVANALGVGVVALVARGQGGDDPEGVRRAARAGLVLAILGSAPLAIVGMLWAPGVDELTLLPSRVAQAAVPLLPWYAAALVPQAWLQVSSAVFRARAEVVLVLLCAGTAAVLNALGDFALAFGWGPLPPLGPRGIAVATALSSAVGAGLALVFLARRGLLRDFWQLPSAVVRSLVLVAWPAGVLQFGWHLGSLVLFVVLGRLGPGAVAATAALTNGLRIEAVLYLPAFALNMAAAVLVGQALGAGQVRRAARHGRRVAATAAALLAALAVPVFVYAPELARLITPDPAAQGATAAYLRFNMVSQPFMAVAVCLGGALQGAGDSRGPMKIVLGFLWGLRLPLAALLGLGTPWGAAGVWIAMVVSQVAQAGAMAARFRRGRWQRVGALP